MDGAKSKGVRHGEGGYVFAKKCIWPSQSHVKTAHGGGHTFSLPDGSFLRSPDV